MITNEFNTKEKVFAVRVLLMGGVGVMVGVVLANLINQYLEYETIQLIGAIVCFGYFLLHLEVTEWDPANELVVFASGFWLAFSPLILGG